MKSWWRRYWPLIPALGMLLGGVFWALSRVLAVTGGRLIYALDDAYIHMAFARRLAEHGTWSVTGGTEFTNCASSIIWPALLGLIYRFTGPQDWLPLALNLLFALAGLYLLNRYQLRVGVAPWFRAALLALVVPLTSLPSLAFVGMEHTLHILLILVVALGAAELLAEGKNNRVTEAVFWCSLPVAVMVRYESLFLAFVLAVLFFLRGNRKRAILILVLAAIPVVAWGIFSVGRGWYFLPNSLMLKGAVPECSPGALLRSAIRVFTMFGENPHLLVLVCCALVLLQVLPTGLRRENSRRNLLWIFILTTALHLQFARTGHFYRYDSYLVAFGWLAAGLATESWLLSIGGWKALRARFSAARAVLALALLVLLFSPLYLRAMRAQFQIPLAAANIYCQQCQMAAFLAEYYSGECVAANDIGAINYYADIRCLDLWGLSSMECARLKKSGEYTAERLEELTAGAGVKIAVVYSRWLLDGAGGIPSGWLEAGRWWTPCNVVLGDGEVTFYATGPTALQQLRNRLREFSGALPSHVSVTPAD